MGLSWVEAKRFLSRRAGFPATVALAGTSLVTTLPAPPIAFSPTVMPPSKVTPDPIEAPLLIRVTSQLHTPSVFNRALHFVARGSRSVMNRPPDQIKTLRARD